MNAESFYEHLVRPLLFSLSAEGAHNVAIRNLRIASNWPAALRQLERFKPPPKPTTAFGLTFPNPIGLAAGMDKHAAAVPVWEALGFGFIELGDPPQHAASRGNIVRVCRGAKLCHRCVAFRRGRRHARVRERLVYECRRRQRRRIL